MCITCSGIHRKLGTHISQVRSITLDTWTPRQVAHFQTVGNAKAAAYFEACLPPDFRRPSPGDAYGMERFIRDKYERRIFVSPENEDSPVSTDHQQQQHQHQQSYQPSANGRLGMANSMPTLGRRPNTYAFAATPSRYDDYESGEAANSHSYSSQFRNATSYQAGPGPGASLFQQSHSAPLYNASAGATGAAYQKASVVKAIMEMGFPATLAARAATVSDGDLQRAVDWVLQQKNAQTDTPSQPPSKAERSLPDLLDFSGEAPSSASANAPKRAVPKSVGLESLMMSSNPAQHAAASAEQADDDDDFADFGAFKSALPVQGSSAANQMSGGRLSGPPGSLNAKLAGLYAQQQAKVAQATTSTPAGNAQLKPLGCVPAQRTSLQHASSMSAAVSANGTPNGKRQSTYVGGIPGASAGVHTVASQKVQNPPNARVVGGADALSHPPSTPPPPPSPQAGFADSNIPPPPTTTPPMPRIPRMPPAQTSRGEGSPGQVKPSPNSDSATNEQAQPKDTASTAEPSMQVPDDPFAVLAKDALSSATDRLSAIGRSKAPSSKQHAHELSKTTELKKENGTSAVAPESTTKPKVTNGFSLEELLG